MQPQAAPVGYTGSEGASGRMVVGRPAAGARFNTRRGERVRIVRHSQLGRRGCQYPRHRLPCAPVPPGRRELPRAQAIVLACALLGFPLIAFIVLDCRPDAICAMLIAVGSMMILMRPWVTGPLRDQVAAGVLLDLALLWKPSVFHLTLVLFGAAMGLAGLRAYLSGCPLKRVLTAGLISFSVAALLALPHYALALPRILEIHLRRGVRGASRALGSMGQGQVFRRPCALLPNWAGRP